MSRPPIGFWPDTLFGRIAAVLLLNLFLIHAAAGLLAELDERHRPNGDSQLPDRVVAAVKTLDSVGPEDRDRFARAISGPGFHVRYLPASPDAPSPTDSPDAFTAELRAQLAQELPPGFALVVVPDGRSREPGARISSSGRFEEFRIGLADGGWAGFRIHRGPPPIHWYPILVGVALVCLVVSLLSLWFARGFSRRLAAFASAADALGRSADLPPLPEGGPREIRLATRAFNRMRERIARFVQDRTQMLAAISHDLRTPLTRLRLRAEFVEDEEQQRKMLDDIAEMEAMIRETLAFVRDDASREQRSEQDLDRLLDGLADSMRESGRDVAYTPAGPVLATFGASALRRAVGNLLENAVNYGSRARMTLRRANGTVEIQIDDDGPGIPPELQEAMFQPFRRMETSRSRDTGGVGLGLSVARTIIRGHGGDIALANRPEGGLRALITLPR